MYRTSKIAKIKAKIKKGEYRFTIHATERRIERKISKQEIECAIESGEIIEEYDQDKYSPSCLILGYTKRKRPLHIQCSIDPVWIITCYDPSLEKDKWTEDYKRRK